MELSTRKLEQALSIRRKIDVLERRLRRLIGGASGSGGATRVWRRGGKRRMSAAARAKIAATARARWVRVKRHGKAKRAATEALGPGPGH